MFLHKIEKKSIYTSTYKLSVWISYYLIIWNFVIKYQIVKKKCCYFPVAYAHCLHVNIRTQLNVRIKGINIIRNSNNIQFFLKKKWKPVLCLFVLLQYVQNGIKPINVMDFLNLNYYVFVLQGYWIENYENIWQCFHRGFDLGYNLLVFAVDIIFSLSHTHRFAVLESNRSIKQHNNIPTEQRKVLLGHLAVRALLSFSGSPFQLWIHFVSAINGNK